MARQDRSQKQRRASGLWGLALVVVILVGVFWLATPRSTPSGDISAVPATPGVIESGPKPSTTLAHPGSMTQGLPGTDSRDNGSPNAGRAAPASDPVPPPAPAESLGAGTTPAPP